MAIWPFTWMAWMVLDQWSVSLVSGNSGGTFIDMSWHCTFGRRLFFSPGQVGRWEQVGGRSGKPVGRTVKTGIQNPWETGSVSVFILVPSHPLRRTGRTLRACAWALRGKGTVYFA